MEIIRGGKNIFKDAISVSQMKRSFEELISFVYRECWFAFGCLVMAGTGIVPPKELTFKTYDEITIGIEPICTLINTVK